MPTILFFLASSQGWSRWASNIGKSLHSEEIRIESVLNEEVTTPISLAEYLEGDRIGIFKVDCPRIGEDGGVTQLSGSW